jgi:hypothetical protein
MPHYVYLYRDKNGQPQYAGYGKRVTRATAHLIESHNPELAAFVRSNKFTINVAGPFKSKRIGLLVETTIISALKPKFNVTKGQSEARFRPLGVPVDFMDRLSMPALQRRDFLRLQKKKPPMPVLFVTVGDKKFDDGRVGYNLAKPPSDKEIRKRAEKWWQLSRLVLHWAEKPKKSPGLLIGINGRPGSQIVIASLRIDRKAWGDKKRCRNGGEGKVSVPLLSTPELDLDAFNLRGRWVDRKAEFAFSNFPSEFFIVLKPDGILLGGRRPQK